MASEVRFVQPPIAPWMRNVLVGLFGLYVVELVLANLRIDLSVFYLLPVGGGFAPWQPFTRFLVQGGGQALFNVIIGLVVLYFALPLLERLLDRRSWTEILISAVTAATVLPLLSDALGLLPIAPRTGWGFLLIPMFVVVGLAQPKATINLMFVLPVPAIWIVWGTLILGLLFLLAGPSSASLEPLAAWIGVMAWWSLRGPGARERRLRKKADTIKRELERFTVLEGGRANEPLGGQRPTDDEWVN